MSEIAWYFRDSSGKVVYYEVCCYWLIMLYLIYCHLTIFKEKFHCFYHGTLLRYYDFEKTLKAPLSFEGVKEKWFRHEPNFMF